MRSYVRVLLCALSAGIFTLAIAEGCGGSGDNTSNSAGSGAATGSAGTSVGGANAGGANAGGALAGTGGSGTSTSSGGSMGPGGSCVPGNTQCTDCIDNDGDGFIDAWDTECIGPLDNDEGSFATGIPGDNVDLCKQDCFFDGNSGSGDDGCLWELACDPKSPGAPKCPYDSNKKCAPPTQQCKDFCLGLTPNGCDCFGCCEITLPNMSKVTIQLAPGCTSEQAADPTVCKPCTQQAECLNTCGTCEYCLGKTTLPPECTPGGSSTSTSTGTSTSSSGGGENNGCGATQQACDPNTPCPVNTYCLTGCCIKIPA